ncbi:TetR/AcrR family transcriptional regulator [Amycolatopsis sp. OK19-0408]|uniref:TetR/AcrR family transcriptional regulator n=1 Tax=Amycolatopsis iheyensis TaxID=2945988 RepID=A0A9X2SIV3_9PSEU|nr:TetR/AcrR family transcriptional regulator [Amycolatopsis iheyensis]MCR6483353.1 TetR/AcrR family transcriptional regulator [Amycolatopsis iheyensis]
MPRSGEEARRRLQQAALELYVERGFDRTTTAEIAARAGVTERTFFRHFPDKREVLFDGEAALRAELTESVADAPDGLPPLAVLVRAFRKSGRILEGNRSFAEPRLAVIAATPALRERDLAKAAAMTDALAAALRGRGVPDRLAALAARIGWDTFHLAAGAWIEESARGLDEHVTEAFADLRTLTAG